MNSKIRVTIINYHNQGGMFHYTCNLANHLNNFVDLTVLTPDGANFSFFEKKIKIKKFSIPEAKNFISLKNLNFLNLIILIERSHPDIIHIVSDHWWQIFIIYWLKIRNYRFVSIIHDVKLHENDDNFYINFINNLNIKSADHLFVHGKKLKELLEHYRSSDYITVINHGDYSFFTKLGDISVTEVPNTLLFFGRIEKYKGLNVLLESFYIVKRDFPEIKLIVAGRGDLKPYSEFLQNNEDITIINSFIDDDHVANLFRQASLIILPYIGGSQSGVIPIAYSFKKPVVATSVGSIAEIVDDGETGLIIEPNNPLLLAQAIKKMMYNEKLRKEMGENAFFKMKRDMSWDDISATFFNIYLKLIHR